VVVLVGSGLEGCSGAEERRRETEMIENGIKYRNT
jgi:hypothetical protein